MLVGSGVYHLVLNRGRGLVGLLINAKIVNLKPEIDLLFFSKRSRFAISRPNLGPHFVGADHEVTGADFARRDRFHLVSQNQGGRSKLFVAEIGDSITAADRKS